MFSDEHNNREEIHVLAPELLFSCIPACCCRPGKRMQWLGSPPGVCCVMECRSGAGWSAVFALLSSAASARRRYGKALPGYLSGAASTCRESKTWRDI